MNGIVFLISHSVSLVYKKTTDFYEWDCDPNFLFSVSLVYKKTIDFCEWDFIPDFSLSMSLVYKKTTHFCMVMLYPYTLLKVLFRCSHILVDTSKLMQNKKL